MTEPTTRAGRALLRGGRVHERVIAAIEAEAAERARRSGMSDWGDAPEGAIYVLRGRDGEPDRAWIKTAEGWEATLNIPPRLWPPEGPRGTR